MVQRPERARVVEIGLLALLAVCFAQVVWWLLDESRYTARVRDAALARHAAEARAANALLATGTAAADLKREFPELSFDDQFRIGDAVLDRLADERGQRLYRFGWEGGFFLLVIVAGMAVLGRALRREAELRRRHQSFVAAVSHEFKTPLASMRLSAETLAKRDPEASRRRELIGRILDDLQRLESMVWNLLDTARIEEARVAIRPEPLDLAPFVAAAINRFAAQADKLGVELASDVDRELVVRADLAACQAVIDNLLDNALKATAGNGGNGGGRIDLAARRDGADVRLDVRDNGVGFAPAERASLFDKFYSVDGARGRRAHGSGLGLYVARRLLELDGGRIDARSEGEGEGAIFSVWWPAAPGLES